MKELRIANGGMGIFKSELFISKQQQQQQQQFVLEFILCNISCRHDATYIPVYSDRDICATDSVCAVLYGNHL